MVDPVHYPIPEGSTSSFQAEASEPLLVQCFADTMESFPPIRRVGDIIRLHRCNLQLFQNRPQVLWFQQKSSYLLFSHPLADELIGLPSCLEEGADDELQELKLEEFSSSETYHIDESVERDYIQFLSVWKVNYFIFTGYMDIIPKSLPGVVNQTDVSGSHDPNRFYNVPIRKMKEIISFQSPSSSIPYSDPSLLSINTSSMDFIGMFVGLFPSGTDNNDGDTRYMYVWDGSCEGGIYPSTQQLPQQFTANDYLKTSLNIYRRIELSVKIISQYNETLIQSNSSPNSSLLSILHISLIDLIKERDVVNSPLSRLTPDQNSRYLPGGFGILAIPASCVSQSNVVSSLQPGTWIRARKIIIGSIEEISHLCRSEIVSARLTVSSSVNVIPPFHWSVISLIF